MKVGIEWNYLEWKWFQWWNLRLQGIILRETWDCRNISSERVALRLNDFLKSSWVLNVPWNPLGPFSPSTPGAPWGPASPGAPGGPVTARPSRPANPGSPLGPAGPCGPSGPSGLSSSNWLPGSPSSPDGPGRPGRPGNPWKCWGLMLFRKFFRAKELFEICFQILHVFLKFRLFRGIQISEIPYLWSDHAVLAAGAVGSGGSWCALGALGSLVSLWAEWSSGSVGALHAGCFGLASDHLAILAVLTCGAVLAWGTIVTVLAVVTCWSSTATMTGTAWRMRRIGIGS